MDPKPCVNSYRGSETLSPSPRARASIPIVSGRVLPSQVPGDIGNCKKFSKLSLSGSRGCLGMSGVLIMSGSIIRKAYLLCKIPRT